MNKTIFKLVFVLFIFISSNLHSETFQYPQQWQQYIYQQEEFVKYLQGLPQVQMEFNPYNSQSRVGRIYRQLMEYSGKQFALFPAQTNTIGQAHHGGIILIDISKLAEPTEVLAFWLAHEWGHQDLGHASNIYRPMPNMDWRYQALPTAREDDADVYAAKFLAAYDYDVEIVAEHLNNLPSSPFVHTHSTGPVRARNVVMAYGTESRSEFEPEYYDITLRMWDAYKGNLASMEIYLDDEYVGSLNNINGDIEAYVDEVSAGNHLLKITNMTVYSYDAWGQLIPFASGIFCQNQIHVSASLSFNLWVNANAQSVTCGVN